MQEKDAKYPFWSEWEEERDARAQLETKSTLRPPEAAPTGYVGALWLPPAAALSEAAPAQTAGTAQRPDYSRQRRWHDKHMRTLSTKLLLMEALLFRALCDEAGVTRHVALGAYVRACNAAGHLLTDPRPYL